MKRRTAVGVTNASALESSPLTRRSNAGKPGEVDARFAPPRRVCGAAKAYRSRVAVRGCSLLATDSQDRPVVAQLIGHRMSGETSECTSEQAMRDERDS